MAESEKSWISVAATSDEDRDELLRAVKQHDLRRIKLILYRVPNITNLTNHINQTGNTLLHVALKNIKEDTDLQKVIDVITFLIDNGAAVDIRNSENETPLDLLEELSEKVANFKWEHIKNIFQDEKIEQNMPKYYKTTQGAKGALQGHTYQLKIIMLFVQRIPEEQPFLMAMDMHKAHKFDDVVLKYQEEGVWKYRFVQAKHRFNEESKIEEHNLFKTAGKKSDNRYFISEYFDSYCKIEAEGIFSDGIRDEFLLCTNIDFSITAKSYFEQIEDRDDLILTYPTIKYKLNIDKIEELRKRLQINSTNEKYFLEFIQKFRFLVKFKDDDIYKLINEALEEYLKLKNIDFATTIMQDRLLKWFEIYKKNKSEFLKIKNKNELLKSLNNTVGSLFAAGYSSYYIKELRRHKIGFKDPLPALKRELSDTIGLFVLVTLSPKISTIKLCQIIKELKLLQDQVILLSTNKLRTNEQLIDTFCDDKEYQLLVIECEREDKICSTILNKIRDASRTKKIVIVGQQEDVENLSEKRFYDNGSSFGTLDENSQDQLLRQQVIFQDRKVSLNQLINLSSAEEIIDDLILEELLLDEIKIGDALKISNIFIEDYYISRTLLKKNIDARILDEEVLNTLNIPDTGLHEDDLCKEKMLDNKIMIIADNPGFGKTTFIQSAANKFKTTIPDTWVLQIDLKSYTSNKRKSLKDILFKETEVHAAIKFLADICLFSNYDNSKNTISRKILVESLKTNNKLKNKYPKIIILFDGFDEISPGFKETTLILLQALKSSNVMQLWITTRTSEEISLEIALCSYALHLKPISEVRKGTFVIKFWEHRLKMENKYDGSTERLQLFAEQLLSDFNEYELRDFTDNPLHLTMIAEVTFKKVIGLEKYGEWKNMTLYFLYEEFINIKTKAIYFIDKRPEDHSLLDQELFESSLKLLRKYLQEISFKMLFSQDNMQLKYSSDLVVQLAKRVGLLITNNEHLQFVHRSFAEYFVCDYFVENFESENIQSLIFHVLTDNNYQLIRKFLNDNQAFLQRLSYQSNCLISVINQAGKYSYLYEMAKERNYNLIINHLRNIPCDLSEKMVMFSKTTSSYYQKETILHRIYRQVTDEEMFINLFNSIRKSVSDTTLKNLLLITLGPKFLYELLHVDCKGNTVLHLASKARNSRVVKYLLEQLKDAPDVLKRLLLKPNTDIQSVLHCIFPNDSQLYSSDAFILSLKEIIEFATPYLNSTELYELLLQPNKDGNTILNLACITASDKCVSYLLKAVEGNHEVCNAFLLKLNKHRQNILHSILLYVKNKSQVTMTLILKEILHFITIHFSSEILYNLLLQVDYQGNTALHFAFILCSYDGATCILDAVKDNFSLAAKLVLMVNKMGKNIIHSIFAKDSKCPELLERRSSILNIFLDMVPIPLNSDVLLSLLRQDDDEGNTSLHSACIANSVPCVNSLLELVKDNPEILTNYILRTNSKGQNILHCIFNNKNSWFSENIDAQNTKIICFLVDFIKCNINYDVLKNLLLQSDNKGNTVLHSASMFHCGKCITSLLEAATDNNDVLKELLLKTNGKGDNVLHCIISIHHYLFGNDEDDIIEMTHTVIDFITNYCNIDLLYDILLQADNEGNTALHLACMFRKKKFITDILEAIKGNHEVVSTLLLKKNLLRQTAFHFIFIPQDFNSFYWDPLILQEIIGFLNNYDSQILYDLLLQTEEEGYTALHYACAFGLNKRLSCLIEAAKSNTEVLNELILKTNCYGQSAFHLTINVNSFDDDDEKETIGIDTTQNFLQLVNRYCGSKVLKKLLKQSDNKGQNALHIACQNISDVSAFRTQKQISIYSNKINILLHFMNVVCPEILSEVLCKRDYTMCTVLHLICNGIYIEGELMRWVIEESKEEGDRKEYVALSKKLDLLSYLLETIKNHTELLKRLLLTTDNHGQTALHYTIYKFKNPDMFKLLFNFVQVNCSGEILREFLYKADGYDCTILHLACKKNKEILICVVNALEGMNEPLGDFFLKKDQWEHSALENALRNFRRENIPQDLLKLWNKHTNVEIVAEK